MTNPTDLKNIGLKATLPRLKILEIFQHSTVRHLTAEDVYRSLLNEELDIGLATVYRVLTQFEQAGLLTRSNFESGKAVFELNEGSHHDHLVCSECGKVTLLDIPCPVTSTEQWLEREYGYRGLSHSLEFFGVCPACLEKRGGVTIPFVSATPSDASSARPALA